MNTNFDPRETGKSPRGFRKEIERKKRNLRKKKKSKEKKGLKEKRKERRQE